MSGQQTAEERRVLAERGISAVERAEHPDVVDHHGRVWTWKDGDLYVHDGALAWPLVFVLDGRHGLPEPGLADRNPNYSGLCLICRREAT